MMDMEVNTAQKQNNFATKWKELKNLGSSSNLNSFVARGMKRLILIEKIDQLEMQIVSKKSIIIVNDFLNLQSKPLNANEAYFTDSLRLRAS